MQSFEMQSCAVLEIHGMPDRVQKNLSSKDALLALAQNSELVYVEDGDYNEDTDTYEDLNEVQDEVIPAFYIFTQSISKKARTAVGFGDALAEYIEREGLGTVTEAGPCDSVNHPSNRVTVFTWAVNRKNFIKWLEANYTE